MAEKNKEFLEWCERIEKAVKNGRIKIGSAEDIRAGGIVFDNPKSACIDGGEKVISPFDTISKHKKYIDKLKSNQTMERLIEQIRETQARNKRIKEEYFEAGNMDMYNLYSGKEQACEGNARLLENYLNREQSKSEPQKQDKNSSLIELEHKLGATQKDLQVTERLLNERQRLLDAIPECAAHGKCVPHALEWIEKAKAVMSEQQPEHQKIDKNNAIIDWLDFNIYWFKERIKPLTDTGDFYAKLAYQMRLASFELVKVCFEQQYKSDSANAAAEQKEQPVNEKLNNFLNSNISNLRMLIELSKRNGDKQGTMYCKGRLDALEKVKEVYSK